MNNSLQNDPNFKDFYGNCSTQGESATPNTSRPGECAATDNGVNLKAMQVMAAKVNHGAGCTCECCGGGDE